MSDEADAAVKPLSEIFGVKPDSAKAPEPAKVEDLKPVEQPAGEGKGEKAGETPAPKAEEKKEEPAPVKKDDPITAMRKALKATQRELQALRNQNQQPKEQSQAPDPIVDAAGFSKHISDQVGERLWQERLADAQEDLSEKLGDAYEETLETFTEMMRERPQLFQEWRASRNPGKFLMKAVEDHRKQQEIGDPVAFADRIRAETRREMSAEIDQRIAEGIKKALGQRLPSSLADEQTQGSGRVEPEPPPLKPKSIGQILAKRK
jgi:hypothetical protein